MTSHVTSVPLCNQVVFRVRSLPHTDASSLAVNRLPILRNMCDHKGHASQASKFIFSASVWALSKFLLGENKDVGV